MVLPLFKLPILVIKLVFETMGFIDIFVLTSTSSKTKRIFKYLVSIRNYKMLLFLEKGEIGFDFRKQSDPSFEAPIYLEPKENQPANNVFLLKIGNNEHVSSKFFIDDSGIILKIYWDTSIETSTKLYNALFELFKMPLDEITMSLDNVTLATFKHWIDWNNDLFYDIAILHIQGKCNFSDYVWILKNVRTKNHLNFEVEPTEYPNDPGNIVIQNVGAATIEIHHGKWIKLQQLNSIKADYIYIWEVSLTDSHINSFLKNWTALEVLSDWKQIKILFSREADLEVVLEGIDATDEDLIKPDDALNQYSFEMANGEKCTIIYAEYEDEGEDNQFGFEFLIGN